jgi:hypothetical protein
LNYYPERQLAIVASGNVKTDAPDRIAAQLGLYAQAEALSETNRLFIGIFIVLLATKSIPVRTSLSPPTGT